MELDIQVIQQHLFWRRDDDLCILLDTGSPCPLEMLNSTGVEKERSFRQYGNQWI